MVYIEIPAWVSELYNTSFGLARLLIVASLVVAAVMLKRRDGKSFALFSVASLGMGAVAWNLDRVLKAPAYFGVVTGRSDGVAIKPYAIVMTEKPHEMVLVLSALLLGFLIAMLVRAALAKLVLTTGAAILALSMFAVVETELIQRLGDMNSPLWNTSVDVAKVAWTVLFFVAVLYAILAGSLFAYRLAARNERKKAEKSSPTTGSVPSDTTSASTVH